MAILTFEAFVADASRRTAILDTNLLILLITARVGPRLLLHFKRVKSFASEDVALLTWVLSRFANVVTTSYVLTEASNLGNSLSGSDRAMWFTELARYATLATEAHIPTSLLGSQPETIRFGFADSALRQLSKEFVVVTAEHRLSGYLEDRDAQVLNFNHLRPLWMIK